MPLFFDKYFLVLFCYRNCAQYYVLFTCYQHCFSTCKEAFVFYQSQSTFSAHIFTLKIEPIYDRPLRSPCLPYISIETAAFGRLLIYWLLKISLIEELDCNTWLSHFCLLHSHKLRGYHMWFHHVTKLMITCNNTYSIFFFFFLYVSGRVIMAWWLHLQS